MMQRLIMGLKAYLNISRASSSHTISQEFDKQHIIIQYVCLPIVL